MNRDMAIFRDPMPIIVEIQLRSIGFLNVDYESMQVTGQLLQNGIGNSKGTAEPMLFLVNIRNPAE